MLRTCQLMVMKNCRCQSKRHGISGRGQYSKSLVLIGDFLQLSLVLFILQQGNGARRISSRHPLYEGLVEYWRRHGLGQEWTQPAPRVNGGSPLTTLQQAYRGSVTPPYGPLYKTMTSSTKPEVHNVSKRRQRRPSYDHGQHESQIRRSSDVCS